MMSGINDRWDRLQAEPNKPVFQLLDSAHPLDFYIGKNIHDELLFLLVDSIEPPSLPRLKTVQITSTQRPDGKWALLLALDKLGLSELFGLMCEDLAECTRKLKRGSTGIDLVVRRIFNWGKLFETGTGLLSSSEVRGLFGELLCLDKFFLNQFDPYEAVRAWQGPMGASQDFQLPDIAWEIKTVHAGSTEVEISSAAQLDTTARPVYLVVISLEEDPYRRGESLNSLTSRIQLRLSEFSSARDLLDEKLLKLGYLPKSEYDTPSFLATTIRTFEVKDQFPRITPGSLIDGVEKVSYRIRLNHCSAFETTPLIRS